MDQDDDHSDLGKDYINYWLSNRNLASFLDFSSRKTFHRFQVPYEKKRLREIRLWRSDLPKHDWVKHQTHLNDLVFAEKKMSSGRKQKPWTPKIHRFQKPTNKSYPPFTDPWDEW